MTHFDVVVLGAGPGGYVAAIRAAQLGLNTAIVEPKYWGGVCLNVGCIPSKALLRNAELAHIFNKEAKTFGISGEATLRLRCRLRPQPQGRRRPRRRRALPDEEEQDHRGPRLRHVHRPQGDVGRSSTRAGPRNVTFDNAIIATGSSTRLVPGTLVVRQRRHLRNPDPLRAICPESIIIAGAGAIGMEFAYVLKNYGVDVTIVEFLPRALPNEDAEVSKEIEKQYKKLGVKILTGTKVERISDKGGDGPVVVTVSKDGKTEELKADKVLQAIGFAPNVEGFGLEAAGVALTDRKAIGIDDYMRTNVPHIYAIGDVTGKLQLAHVAEAQGVVAAETIGGAETLALGDYRMMPRATFCQPQVASFGLTEEQAKAEGYDVVVAKFPFTANGKAHGSGRPDRFREAHRGQEAPRTHRRAPDRARRVRTAAGADAGPEVGPDRQRAGPQRAHPPDPVGGAAGVLPRSDRPHDQLLRERNSRRHQSDWWSATSCGWPPSRWPPKAPESTSGCCWSLPCHSSVGPRRLLRPAQIPAEIPHLGGVPVGVAGVAGDLLARAARGHLPLMRLCLCADFYTRAVDRRSLQPGGGKSASERDG